jgi:metal-dependent HD superfamily phosphatase/phosphodiesterase
MDLEQLVNKKIDIERRRERLLGKLEVAKSSLLELDKRLVERGINPDTLEEEINRLKAERQEAIILLNEALLDAEQVITRIESRVDSL